MISFSWVLLLAALLAATFNPSFGDRQKRTIGARCGEGWCVTRTNPCNNTFDYCSNRNEKCCLFPGWTTFQGN